MQPAVAELVDDVHRVQDRHLVEPPHAGEMEEGVAVHDCRRPPDRPAQDEAGGGDDRNRKTVVPFERQAHRPERSERSPAEIIPRTTIVRERDPLAANVRRNATKIATRLQANDPASARPSRRGQSSERRSSAPGRNEHAGRGGGEPQAEPRTLRGKEP